MTSLYVASGAIEPFGAKKIKARPISGHVMLRLRLAELEVALTSTMVRFGSLIRATFLIAVTVIDSDVVLNWSLFVPDNLYKRIFPSTVLSQVKSKIPY